MQDSCFDCPSQRAHKPKKEKVEHFKRAERFVFQYRQLTKQKQSISRRVKQGLREPTATPDAKLMLVVRIRGPRGLSRLPIKVLRLFKLEQLNSASFIRVTKATLNMLRIVEPYVTYGYDSLRFFLASKISPLSPTMKT